MKILGAAESPWAAKWMLVRLPRERRGIVVPLLGLAVVLSVSGCAAAPWSDSFGSRLPWGNATGEGSPVLSENQQIDVQMALGRTLERQQQWDAARSVYSEILRVRPEQGEAAHRLAIIYDQQGDAESAAVMFEQALRSDPENPDIFCDIAYSLYRQGDLAASETNFRRALRLEPQHRRARNQLGMVLARTERRDEALDHFRQAGCTTSEAHANLAFALLVDRKTREAAEALRIASQSDSVLPEHRRRLDALASLVARAEGAGSPEQEAPTRLAARPVVDGDSAAGLGMGTGVRAGDPPSDRTTR